MPSSTAKRRTIESFHIGTKKASNLLMSPPREQQTTTTATPSSSSSSSSSRRPLHHGRLELPDSWEESFADDVRTFWCPHQQVDVLDTPPSSLVFLRDYVSPSRPCIIRNAIRDPQTGNPLHLTLDSIMSQHHLNPDTTFLTVDVTPDGHGDCIREVQKVLVPPTTTVHENENDSGSNQPQHPLPSQLVFVYPKQVKMSLTNFREQLRRQEERLRLRVSGNPPPPTTTSTMHHSSLLDINGLRTLPSIPPITEDNVPTDSHRVRDENIDDSVVYYSRQNDCLRTPEETIGSESGEKNDITNLATLVPPTIEWAAEAFGTPLEAINLWMGNQCSVSSMHKDFYENLFYVASGTKVFCLCPPGDAAFLDPYHVEYPMGQFEYHDNNKKESGSTTRGGSWGVVMHNGDPTTIESIQTTNDDDDDHNDDDSDDDEHESTPPPPASRSTTQWIYPDVSQLLPHDDCIDNDDDNGSGGGGDRRDHGLEHRSGRLLKEFPHLQHVHPIEIQVQAGELLYLPALWFHRVTQIQETIGVNYWYDMRFDHPSWCYFNLLQQMKCQDAATSQ